MTTSEVLFNEFRKKEYFRDVKIEIDNHEATITFYSEGGRGLDIKVQSDNTVRFNSFECDVENIELLAKAINALFEETWGLDND
jgi:hypothetical protein